MASIRTKAIVLRRTNYGEADRILQLLTPDNGRVSVIAKGSRREKSKLAGAIELFAVCDVTIHQGKGDLGIITGARLEVFYGNIVQEYDRLQTGYECIKQVAKATESVDDSSFYTLLQQSLESLHQLDIDIRIIKAWFQMQYAILLGVGPNLATDNHGMKLVEDARYDFSPHENAFIFAENGQFSAEHIKLLRLLSAQPPRVAAQVNTIDKLLDDCLWFAERAAAS